MDSSYALIYRGVVRAGNPFFIAAVAAPALARVENAKEKAPAEDVEDPLPKGIWNILSAFMCSLHGCCVIEKAV